MMKDNGDGTFSIVASCSFEKPKPLSDEEIQNIWYQHEKWLATVPLSFARAIEERHGIK